MFSSKLSTLKEVYSKVKYFSFKQKDGLIAIFFIAIYLAYFYFLMNFWYSPLMKNSYFPISHPRLYAVLGITLHQIPIVILLFIILKRSKQTLSSIGFRKRIEIFSLNRSFSFCLYTYINTKNKWISIRNVLFPLLLYN